MFHHRADVSSYDQNKGLIGYQMRLINSPDQFDEVLHYVLGIFEFKWLTKTSSKNIKLKNSNEHEPKHISSNNSPFLAI